jgi:outer membrane biosynthesis protein TonB
MAKTGRFWRNVVLIALAHVALIAGLIRWSLAARASSYPESIVWLGGAGDITAGQENDAPPSAKRATPPAEAKPSKDNEADSDKPVVTTAKSEIELPSSTSKPTPTAASTPKPAATPTPKPKPTPKPIPKPTPKKAPVAKASPKPSPKAKPGSAKANEKSEKHEKSAQTRSGGLQSAVSGGGSSASEFGWYGNMLHDRFYSAWVQPTTNIATGTKISTLVKIRIEKGGRVSKFEIIKPSENIVVNESVAAVAKQVTEVDPPPVGLIKGDHYDVKINFELNTEQQMAK